jgi:hypothetical protein
MPRLHVGRTDTYTARATSAFVVVVRVLHLVYIQSIDIVPIDRVPLVLAIITIRDSSLDRFL